MNRLLMGDYGIFVWSAYALTLMAMGGEVLLLYRRRRAQREHMQATERGGRQEQV